MNIDIKATGIKEVDEAMAELKAAREALAMAIRKFQHLSHYGVHIDCDVMFDEKPTDSAPSGAERGSFMTSGAEERRKIAREALVKLIKYLFETESWKPGTNTYAMAEQLIKACELLARL